MSFWSKNHKFKENEAGVIVVAALMGSNDGSFESRTIQPIGFEDEGFVVQGVSRPSVSAQRSGRKDEVVTIVTGPFSVDRLPSGVRVIGHQVPERAGCVWASNLEKETQPLATVVRANTKR